MIQIDLVELLTDIVEFLNDNSDIEGASDLFDRAYRALEELENIGEDDVDDEF